VLLCNRQSRVWSGRADNIKNTIRSYGIEVLEGDCKTVTVGGQRIQVCGVDDPDGFEQENFFGQEIAPEWDEQLERCKKQLNTDMFLYYCRIALSGSHIIPAAVSTLWCRGMLMAGR